MGQSNLGKRPWNKGKKGLQHGNRTSFKKGSSPWIKGKHHSKEARKKMSIRNKGRTPWNKGLKGTQVAWNKGKNHSEETRRKLSISHKDQHSSPRTEFKKNHVPWIKGKHHSSKSKKQMSDALKGRIPWNKDKTHSEKTKQKLRKARLNQVFPKKDSSIEVFMQEELDRRNIKYKKHVAFFGQPDLFIEPNICIFCDGDYWHKYPNGRKRDKKVNKKLEDEGFQVIRFWGREIRADVESCGHTIEVIRYQKN